ncbi:MAG: PAS domain S-box protein [Deltaproteobacteria bacterium]|nr:PAS domain S-box protein [Deltaproteobacteria bacterium]
MVKCWEFFECDERECPVHKSKELRCWLISGTHCRNEIQGKFLEKMEMCLECQPFMENMDTTSLEATLKLLNEQFAEFRGMVDERDAELKEISMELSLGLSEVFEALKEISSGDTLVRIPETSKLELVSKLKNMVNLAAQELGEIVDLSHEFAMGLAEHFNVLLGVSRGDLTARVSGVSKIELLESLKNVTNQMIENISREISERQRVETAHLESMHKLKVAYGQSIVYAQQLRDQMAERRQAEEACRESEERYRTVLEASPDPVVVYDMEGKCVYINPVFTKVFGWTPEELLGRKIDYVPDVNRPETKVLIDKVLAGESFSGVESRRYTKEGNILDVSISAGIYLDRARVPVGSVHTLRDITDHKRAEKGLLESEEKYSTLVENSLTGIYIDQGGKVVLANKRFAEIYGYSKDELDGIESWKLVHPDDKALTGEMRAKRLKGEPVPLAYEARGMKKDGQIIWVRRRNARIEYQGRPAVLGNVVDITQGKRAEQSLRKAHDELEQRVEQRTAELTKTNEQLKREIEERKRAEKDLKLSEEKYRLLFNNDPNPLFLVDMDSGKILDANNPASLTYRYERKKLKEMSFSDLFDPDEGGRLWNELENSHRDVYVFIPRVSARKKDGRRFFIHLHASVVRLEEPENGTQGRSLIVRTVDITRRLEQEALLVQTGKMATLGEMATGVAHELNQPLNVIQVGTDFLAKMIKRGKKVSDDELLKVSRNISGQVKRATNIVGHLREFGRKSDLNVYPVDLNEPIRDVFTLLGQQLKLRNIKVNFQLESAMPKILGDKNRLEQIFLNLITNARDAMEAKGPEAIKELTITTYQEGKSVLAAISDTGIGVPNGIQKKIFDPFFTTKEAGKGTGLGLSITYNLVKDFRGDIDVESASGGGTTFRVKFPIYE